MLFIFFANLRKVERFTSKDSCVVADAPRSNMELGEGQPWPHIFTEKSSFYDFCTLLTITYAHLVQFGCDLQLKFSTLFSDLILFNLNRKCMGLTNVKISNLIFYLFYISNWIKLCS